MYKKKQSMDTTHNDKGFPPRAQLPSPLWKGFQVPHSITIVSNISFQLLTMFIILMNT
jgi:hypothetical protein